MTLEEFINDLNEHLDEYNQKNATKNFDSTQQLKFTQYMALYALEGTPQNNAVKQASRMMLNDTTFLSRLQSCIDYVIAMTAAAVLIATQEGKENV